MNGFERLGIEAPEAITENKIFNAARKTVTLLVESPADTYFWSMWVHDSVLIRASNGKPAAIEIISRAAEGSEMPVVAVLDSDWDRVMNCIVNMPDIVYTDGHDLEVTVAAGGFLSRVVTAHARSELAAAERKWGQQFLERLFAHALAMMKVRLYKYKNNVIEMCFKKFSKNELLYFDKYSECHEAQWAPNADLCARAICNYSNCHGSLKSIVAWKCDAASPEQDRNHWCNGHDLVGFTRSWLKEYCSSTKVISEQDIRERMYMAVDAVWLRSTTMWVSLEEWQNRHTGFTLLKEL